MFFKIELDLSSCVVLNKTIFMLSIKKGEKIMKGFFITCMFLLSAVVLFSAQGEKIIKETATPNPHYYAVIISGGIDDSYNYLRYWNDMSSIFCALTQVYGYMPENIFVHSTDGTIVHNHGSLDLDRISPPYTDDIDLPASKSNITNSF